MTLIHKTFNTPTPLKHKIVFILLKAHPPIHPNRKQCEYAVIILLYAVHHQADLSLCCWFYRLIYDMLILGVDYLMFVLTPEMHAVYQSNLNRCHNCLPSFNLRHRYSNDFVRNEFKLHVNFYYLRMKSILE